MTDATLDIRPLSPERLQDFLAYFDGPAFADNPQWASCYCQFMYVDHRTVRWDDRSGEQNRASACERICASRMNGLLAYRDNAVVGWCNAAPRALLDGFAGEPDTGAERLGQITCFVVARAHRRTGVARALLDAACAQLKAQGMTIAEGAPRPEAATDAHQYHGPLRLYEEAGFTHHRTDADGTVWMRKRL